MHTSRLVLFALILAAAPLRAEAPVSGPWTLAELQKPSRVTWVDETGPLRKLYYESEPYRGKPTRVFAYFAQPENVQGQLPAMVLVHGGGGTAFAEWARLWAKRGYAALAMDLAGHGPDGKRLPDGGPGQGDGDKFPLHRTDLRDVWTYHAVAAVIRGHSLLRRLPQVDPDKIGITGISWGGYLTCLVAGLDERFKVAVPVYGCGFIHENSYDGWLKLFARMPADWRGDWVANFEPSRYLGRARMPLLFVNGTNDFAYPLDSYQKSYRLVKDRHLCIIVNLPHGHPQGWAPVEIGLFADQHLRGGEPLPAFVGEERRDGGRTSIACKAAVPLEKAGLHWTTDTTGPWQKRAWKSKPARIEDGRIHAELPEGRPVIYYLTVTDRRGATVSTEHQVLE